MHRYSICHAMFLINYSKNMKSDFNPKDFRLNRIFIVSLMALRFYTMGHRDGTYGFVYCKIFA
jgi:hypothetical protein